jgi:hypothetical protein
MRCDSYYHLRLYLSWFFFIFFELDIFAEMYYIICWLFRYFYLLIFFLWFNFYHHFTKFKNIFLIILKLWIFFARDHKSFAYTHTCHIWPIIREINVLSCVVKRLKKQANLHFGILVVKASVCCILPETNKKKDIIRNNTEKSIETNFGYKFIIIP